MLYRGHTTTATWPETGSGAVIWHHMPCFVAELAELWGLFGEPFPKPPGRSRTTCTCAQQKLNASMLTEASRTLTQMLMGGVLCRTQQVSVQHNSITLSSIKDDDVQKDAINRHSSWRQCALTNMCCWQQHLCYAARQSSSGANVHASSPAQAFAELLAQWQLQECHATGRYHSNAVPGGRMG